LTTFADETSNTTYMARQTMEQRGQSQACLYFAESRQRKAEGQYARATVASLPNGEAANPELCSPEQLRGSRNQRE